MDRDAIEGFHRTKVRSLLAQSVPSSTSAIDGRSIGSRDEAHLIDQLNTTDVVGGSSSNNSVYYLRNRRAKHPLSREKYERDRKVRRLIHDRARKRAKQEETGEKEAREGGRLAVGRDDDEIEEDDGGNTNFDDLTEREQEAVDRNIKEAIEQTHDLMPSGTLLETIHYVASHYYDARGKLFLATNRSGEKEKKKAQKGNGETNVWRAFESNALVALGVYLEEMIKYEATGAAAGSNEGAEEETLDVAEKLAQVQDEIRKQRRRTRTTTPTPAEQPTKKKAKARKNARRNRVDVGWALPKSQSGPSRRQIESSPALDAAGDDDNDDDDNHDNDSDDNDDRSSQGNGSEASSEQSSTSRE